jgi:hypothetical protein
MPSPTPTQAIPTAYSCPAQPVTADTVPRAIGRQAPSAEISPVRGKRRRLISLQLALGARMKVFVYHLEPGLVDMGIDLGR